MNIARSAFALLVVHCISGLAAIAHGQQKLPDPPPPTPAAAPAAAPAANAATTPAATDSAPPAGDQPAFKPEELEQMLAPLALYPDSLLAQVFMASTYPIEVVEADRWVKANTSLKGDALAKELEKKPWDASVRSLVNFPQVLAMMSENLSTTVKIGDAFIGQQKEVMDTVQKLRAKAKETGNLQSTKEQNVSTKTDNGTQVIVIESSSPEVIYVPQYNPTVVYGSWPYPAYPPYPYYPPGYVASNVVSFGLGVACGVAWGYAMGGCNWGHGDVDIDINRNTNFNGNINRNQFKGQNGSFRHDPAHRQGASYRNQASANRVGATSANNRATQARSDYRGRAEAGRSDINRGGADAFKGNTRAPSNAAAGANRPSSGARPTTSNASPSNRGGAFNSASQGGQSARDASNRGSTSRSTTSSAARSSPSRSSSGGGASRGGGGGGRGGGGRR